MKKILIIPIILTFLFYSCEKTEEDSTQAAKDHLLAEQVFNDVGYIVEEGLLVNEINTGCASYSLMNIDTSDTKILIIDFGNTNCLHNSKLRRGVINITYTGKYRDSLAVITTTFDKYYVNNNLVQGERVVTNKGRNLNGNMWFTIAINNASINTSNGIINWESNRTREWISGNSTYDFSDDNYRVTGSSSGIGVNNNSFSMEIMDPLNVDLGCLPDCIIKSGTSKISPTGYADRIINYGVSLCDCNFDVIINGTTYPIVVD